MRKVIAISLPQATARQVDRIVARERYASTSELFRDLLREWGRREVKVPRRSLECPPPLHVAAFIRAVKKHAKSGGAKTLSRNHDRYLYGK